MFAVPGWSISAASLQSETTFKGGDRDQSTKSRKRKRGTVTESKVNSANVGSLWESVVEGKNVSTKRNEIKSASHKKMKKEKDTKSAQGAESIKSPAATPADSNAGNRVHQERAGRKTKKDELRSLIKKTLDNEKPHSEGQAAPASQTMPTTPVISKLTPLQIAMRDKLISARFRHLNETLYSRPSEESYTLFQDSPEMFSEYHEGFRQQVKIWPENPVDSFLKDIRARGKIRQPSKDKSRSNPSSLATTTLPRTAGTCTIADLGCGDAQIAQSLQADRGKLHIDVKSFDLQSPNPLITKADIANLPLEDGQINVAIFCLALMGTNWIDFVEEAYRILHWKGELWVAEIKSRFAAVKNRHTRVEHSVGNRQKAGKKSKGHSNVELSSAHTTDLAVEVDGAEDRRRETDVTAFVEALKKRGFVLNGESAEAVDLSNKMFVKMRFIKGATPTKGRGVPSQGQNKGERAAFAPRQGQVEDIDDNVDESAILKPCVYKIR